MGRTTTGRKQVKAKDPDRLIKVGNIVGMPEIAARTNSTPRAVWNHTRRYAFPEPVTRTSNTPLWDWDEVKAFYDNWEPSKGGYHTHAAQRAAVKKTAARKPRRQFMEGDDDGTRSKRKTA